MSQPVRIDLHARSSSDLQSLRPLLDAFEELGESAELSADGAIDEAERGTLPIGPLPCAARVIVGGRGDFAPISRERAIVLLDTLEPGESLELSDEMLQADLILTASQSQAVALALRVSTKVTAVGVPRLDRFLADPAEAAARARQKLGVWPGGQLVLWAPRQGTPPWTEGAVSVLLGMDATVAVLPDDWPPEQIDPLRSQALRRANLMALEPEDATLALEAADLVISNCGELLRRAAVLGKSGIRIEGTAAAPRDAALDAAFGEPLWHAEGVKDAVLAATSSSGSAPASALQSQVAEPGRAARRAAQAVLDHLEAASAASERGASEAAADSSGKSPVWTEDQPSGFLESIEAQVAFGNVREALEQLEEHLTGWPSPRGFTLLASIQRGRDELEGATRAIERAEQLARDELGRALCERARIELEADRGAAARELFAEASSLAPGLADPLVGLGSLALHGRDAAAAEEHFRSAVQIESSARSRAGLGLALAAQGRAPEAVTELEASLDLEPDTLAAIHGLVQACFQNGELAPAERRVSAYLETHPGNLDMAFTLAGLRLQLGDHDGALEMLERIELFNPEYAGLAELREKLRAG
jgi:tetratricopeptide (TPR) repeat protein